MLRRESCHSISRWKNDIRSLKCDPPRDQLSCEFLHTTLEACDTWKAFIVRAAFRTFSWKRISRSLDDLRLPKHTWQSSAMGAVDGIWTNGYCESSKRRKDCRKNGEDGRKSIHSKLELVEWECCVEGSF